MSTAIQADYLYEAAEYHAGEEEQAQMIRKIVKVDKAGIYQNWRPGNSQPDFERINVVYGGNGCGKSTLAGIFGALSRQEPTEAAIQIQIEENGSPRAVQNPTDQFWSTVRVFNKAYIRENLFFDADHGSDAVPLLVLGKPNVDREKRLAAIRSRIEELDRAIPLADSTVKRHKKAYGTIATDTARRISEELGSAVAAFKPRVYNASAFKRRLDKGLKEGSTDVANDLAAVQNKEMDRVALLGDDKLSLDALMFDLEALLATRVINQAIAELKDNRQAEQWVEQGLGLHEHTDTCMFCSGPLTAKRIDELDQHFDASFTALQAALNSLDGALADRAATAARALQSAPDPGLVYEDLRDRYKEQLQIAENANNEYQERVDWMRRQVDAKRAKPLTALQLGDERPGDGNLEFGGINQILEDHNRRNRDFERAVIEAANRVEQTRIGEVAESYNSSVIKESDAQKELGLLTTERAELVKERLTLSEDALDGAPLAAELTRDVGILLGRRELSFVQEGRKFSIRRDGEPATHLSEGERTAISLLYFLCSLRDHETEDIAATVIIDDPVTSLDNDILSGASSHLWHAFVERDSKHQVFLLTHSFELFRMWGNQLDRLYGSKLAQSKFTLHELRTTYVEQPEGKPVRSPLLLPWTSKPMRKKLRSQYHYLFWRVGNVIAERRDSGDLSSDLEAAAIIPNAARKMLEGFFAFKYPSSLSDFTASMERASNHEDVSDVTRHRVLRFVHQHSHNEEADISRSIPVGESVTVLAAAMELIQVIDQAHFIEMCEALDLEPSRLVIPE